MDRIGNSTVYAAQNYSGGSIISHLNKAYGFVASNVDIKQLGGRICEWFAKTLSAIGSFVKDNPYAVGMFAGAVLIAGTVIAIGSRLVKKAKQPNEMQKNEQNANGKEGASDEEISESDKEENGNEVSDAQDDASVPDGTSEEEDNGNEEDDASVVTVTEENEAIVSQADQVVVNEQLPNNAVQTFVQANVNAKHKCKQKTQIFSNAILGNKKSKPKESKKPSQTQGKKENSKAEKRNVKNSSALRSSSVSHAKPAKGGNGAKKRK
ncbi:MAG: hypothetical protein LBT64_03115 [Puniceicoccales bacterium]|jgi:hypothetical protein|nr:hypothetical protein [Puniceicoccales bacterium]